MCGTRPIPWRRTIDLAAELSDLTFVSHSSSVTFIQRCLMSSPSEGPATVATNSDSLDERDMAFWADVAVNEHLDIPRR